MTSPSGTILITGANGGLGSAMSAQLYGVYTARNAETATTLSSTLAHAEPNHKYEKLSLDLSQLSNVRDFASQINKRIAEGSLPRIRALILNAAYQEHTTHAFTGNGFDMSFQCSYLSHWLLTLLLLQSMDKEHGRIVVLGSSAHDPYDPRNDGIGIFKDEKWKTVFHDTDSIAKGTWSSTKDDPTFLAGLRRYGAGKLCEIMMIYNLQRRLNNDPALSRISVLGVDPGGMPTTISRRGNFFLSVVVPKILPIIAAVSLRWSPNGAFRTTKKSAGDVLRAAFDTQVLGEQPKAVYLNGSEPFESSAESRDQTKQETLWQDSVKYTGLTPEETALVAWN